MPAIPDLPEISHDHPDVTGGWLRPAVFGAMDGLVSNLALIAGVAGGTRDHTGSAAVVLAGLAGLAAGAFSMAAGEYTSVASQSEAAQREIDKERREIIANPEAEAGELAEMYVAKGIDPVLAAEVSRQIHANVDNAVAVHAREELGVDPDDLASPMVAAVSSFLSFAVGALIPVLPYLLGADSLVPGLARDAARAVPVRRRRDPGDQPVVVVRRLAADGAGRRGGRPDVPVRQPRRERRDRLIRPSAGPSRVWATRLAGRAADRYRAVVFSMLGPMSSPASLA